MYNFPQPTDCLYASLYHALDSANEKERMMKTISKVMVEMVTLAFLAACSQGYRFNSAELAFASSEYAARHSVYVGNPLEE